jgi:hypothetical protein
VPWKFTDGKRLPGNRDMIINILILFMKTVLDYCFSNPLRNQEQRLTWSVVCLKSCWAGKQLNAWRVHPGAWILNHQMTGKSKVDAG